MENRQGLYIAAIQEVALPVKAETHILKGQLLKTTSGFVEPVATAGTATTGTSVEEMNNTSLVNGAKFVLVEISKDQIVRMKKGTGTFVVGSTCGIGADAQTLDQDEANKTHTCVRTIDSEVIAKPIVSTMQI